MSVLPRIALFLQYVLPRNSRNTQNLLAVYSPTDCTDLHRTFLLYILPQIAQIYTEPSCCMFSHGIHGIHRTFLQYILPRNSRNTQNLLAVCSPTDFTDLHRTFLLYILPRIAQIFTDAAFRGCTCLKCTNPFCWCTSCSVGALETSAPPERTYLCRSVKSVGEYFQQPLP